MPRDPIWAAETHFHTRDGRLHAEDVALDTLAEAVGTPFYCYSSGALETAYGAFARAVSDLPALVCYALKANPNMAVVRSFARLGAGADVVSEGGLSIKPKTSRDAARVGPTVSSI